MDSDELSYKFLRRIQQLEKNSPMLTNIDSDFYYKLSDYLNSLEMAAKNENDPQKNKLINDEVQNIKKIANSIYDLREKKIVQSALSKSRGGKPDIKNMLEKNEWKVAQLILNYVLVDVEIQLQKRKIITYMDIIGNKKI